MNQLIAGKTPKMQPRTFKNPLKLPSPPPQGI
jgi:hypothetical protein